jgi:F0F1-type ATP synthase membrane subunit b/b'
MREKLTALLLAVLLTVAIIPTLAVTSHAQNATSTTNTTTTETNTTLPLEATQLPVFPEPEAPEAIGNQTNQTETETPSGNQTESKDNATKVIGLLDDAQLKIDEARNLIRALQAQIQADKQQPGAATNETSEIIESANESAEDIIDIVIDDITNDTEVVDNIENATEDITDAINGSINDASNATIDVIDNATDIIIDLIDNATENSDNSTTEVAIDNAMIRLLSNLVAAQDYNGGLSEEERDELKANLQDAIAEIAGDAADAARNN